MRTVRYTADAARDLKRYGTVAKRVTRAMGDYAANPDAHYNNVTQLVGSPYHRMRVGDYRVIFDDSGDELLVLKVRPRGSAYD